MNPTDDQILAVLSSATKGLTIRNIQEELKKIGYYAKDYFLRNRLNQLKKYGLVCSDKNENRINEWHFQKI